MERRLRLQPIRLEDVDHVMTWVNDAEVVKNFQHFDRTFTREDELAFIRGLLEETERRKSFTFSIFRTDDDTYIGQCAINQISWENRLGRMATTISKDHWGQGYAGEVIELLLAHAFDVLELNKVWAMVYASNEKGLHVDLKAGFKKEGLLRQEYYWRGEYHDIVRIGILKEDFLTRKAVRMVQCSTCDREFEPVHVEAPDQGDGCSVEVIEKDGRLTGTGHYGSREFDGDDLDFTGSAAKPKPGIACDECVQHALDAGGRIVRSSI